MKKVYTLVLITLGILGIQQSYAQCTVTASASPYAICIGDSTLLTASASIPGTYYTFDFNDNTLPPGWSITGGASFDTLPACAAPTLDNTAFYWSSTSGSTPIITTTDLDVSSGGTINYEFRFAGNSSSSPCETADQYNEGVALEYSTDGGGSWALVVYHCSVPAGGPWAFVGGYSQTLTTIPVSTTPGNGNGSTGIYDVWAPYVIPIPLAAQTTSTRFRWRQPNSSGSCCDNWGLDNINVAAQPNLFYLWSNMYNGFGASSQYITNLTTDTCLLVLVTDTTTGQNCSDTVCISVDSLPNLMLAYSNPFCVGELVSFDGSASDPGITSYQWDLDNNGTYEVTSGSPVYNASGSFTSAGNYTIQFQGLTPGGCNASLDTVVQVFNNPTIGANVLDPTVCPYNAASFTGSAFMFNAPGQSSTVSNYSWDLDFDGTADTSGSGLTAVSNFYSGLGPHSVVLTVTSNMGCVTSDTVVVTIVDIPHGNIVAPQVCGNMPANLSFNNTGTPPATTYAWNFGDPGTTSDVSSSASPNYLYPGSGFYTVTLVAGTSDGCLDTMTTIINIDPLPAGTIDNLAVCQGVDEVFNLNQSSADSIVGYSWVFPGGNPGSSTDSVETVNFSGSGPINVSVIITNQYGCIDTVAASFLVRTLPNAGFGVYPICISRFTFDPFSPNANADLDWTLGDGTSIMNQDTTQFNYIYTAPGDYTASLIITDEFGCVNSSDTVVHVDDSLFIQMPNVLVQSSSINNDKVDMDELSPGFNLCIDYTYTIFDRWGIKVFQTHNDPYNPDLNCDACFRGVAQNGAVLVPGVYYYVMEGNFNILKAGSITIFE
jgi:PKD repeat protein